MYNVLLIIVIIIYKNNLLEYMKFLITLYLK